MSVRQKNCVCYFFLSTILWASISIPVWTAHAPWQEVKDGLFIGMFQSPKKSTVPVKDSLIYIVKIDPNLYNLRLLCGSEHGRRRITGKEWCRGFGLLVAINASMYKKDHLTSTGLMMNYDHVNNPNDNPKFGAIMAFNPSDSTENRIPRVQIIDEHEQQDWRKLSKNYQTLVENYRLITLNQTNAWEQSDQIYSIAAVGIDEDDNVLFIFTRAPYSGHDFADILLSVPISIRNAMYVEGGPAATLYLAVGRDTLDKFGSYETSCCPNDANTRAEPLPNVIGIVEKK